MSKHEIEKRIRTLFYLLFGVIFTFLFILTSTYLDLTNEAGLTFKKQTIAFIEDGINTRERFFFEDLSSRSYNSINLRISNFLNSKNISEYRLVVFANKHCEWGDLQLCNFVTSMAPRLSLDKITTVERLNKLYILYPIQGWNETDGLLGLEVPTDQIVLQQSFLEKLSFHVIPFLILIALTASIYLFTEKQLIKPTIQRMIDSEKLQTQKELVRQFAHDIRSPITVLEELIENYPLQNEDAQELVTDALNRVKGISNDLLDREKKLNRLVNIKELIDNLVKSKKLEFKHLRPAFKISYTGRSDHFEINPNDLYRTVSNLINNSIEAVKADAPLIEVNIVQNETSLEVLVKDNGEGISPENLSLIEMGYFTSKSNGNGLGIRGIKKWLDSLGGDLKISSAPGSGTSITMTIPALEC